MADVEAGWLEEGNYDADQAPVSNDNDYVAPPVRVHIVATETENVSPQLCIHSTVPIPQAGAAIAGSTQPNVGRVLTHNYHRYKAKMQINPGPGCYAVVTSYKMDSLTNPTPSGAIFYADEVTGQVPITAPAVPATGVAAQNPYSFPIQVVIAPNGATITAVTVNGVQVGTAAGTYGVPAFGSISIAYTVATPTWVWSPLATSYMLPDYDAQRPMYMVALGGPATVSVWDEAYPVVVK